MSAKQDIPPGDHKLRSNVLGLFESSIMGIAGSAPAYSIAATTVTLALTVGLFGPGELFYSGIAMFGVVVAFHYMGKHRQNAGATYIWVRNALHPILGYLAGWSLVTASIIFGMVSTVPASTSLLSLFTSNDKIISNVHWTTLVGVIIFLIMVAIIAVGIKFTAKAQVLMTVIELGLLWIFDILALFHHPKTHHFSLSWFSFNSIKSYSIPSSVLGSTQTPFDVKYVTAHGLSAILIGAVSGAFFYWGWDVTANLNEETKDGHKTAGQGGIIGTLFVAFTFLLTLVSINLVLSDATLSTSGSVLSAFAAALIPGWFGKLIVVSVLLSTVATIETQMIQVTRTLFSMGRDKTLPQSMGKVHTNFKTPWNATLFHCICVALLYWFAICIQRKQHRTIRCCRDWNPDLLLLRLGRAQRHRVVSPLRAQERQELRFLGSLATDVWRLFDRRSLQGNPNIDSPCFVGWRWHRGAWHHSDGNLLDSRIGVFR